MTNKPGFIKYKGLAKTLRVISSILFWLSLVGCGISIVGSIIIRALSDSTINSIFTSSRGSLGFTIGNFLNFKVPPELLDSIDAKPIFSAIIILAGLSSAVLVVILKYLTIILKNVEDNRPFSIVNARSIRIIGIATVIASIVIQIAYAYSAHVAINALEISNLGVNYSINANIFFMGLLLILLSEIFRYGAYLQQEYDETL